MHPSLPVSKFEYTGVIVHSSNEKAPYSAAFKEWTSDPGVAVFTCDDGHERLIPIAAVEGFRESDYPAQVLPKNEGLIVGQPCSWSQTWDGVMPAISTVDKITGFMAVMGHTLRLGRTETEAPKGN